MSEAKDLSKADRQRIIDQSNQMFDQFGNRISQQEGLENQYRGQADAAYAPLLAGKGGYTPEQQAQITRDAELKGLTPYDQGSLYLTPQEQWAMQGDPYGDVTKYLNPGLMSGIAEDSGNLQRNAYEQEQTNVNAAVDPALMRYDPSVRAAVTDRSKLALSPGFLPKYNLSDADKQSMITAAANNAQAPYSAQIDTMNRNAAAAGVNPVGQAAMTERLTRKAAQDEADAATQARLGATNLQRQLMGQGEQMRLDSERGIASNAMAAENSRIGAEQGLSGQLSSNALNVGRDINNTEAQIGERKLGAAQYNQNAGTAAMQYADTARANRAANVAQNRQGVTQYNVETPYNRGLAANDRLSGRYTQTANANLQAGQEGRQYLTGQQQLASANVNDAQKAQVAGATGMADAENRATSNYVNANAQPGTGSKIFGAITGGLSAAAPFLADGGIIDEPGVYTVGEAGPEAIIPLSKPNYRGVAQESGFDPDTGEYGGTMKHGFTDYLKDFASGYAKGGLAGGIGSAAGNAYSVHKWNADHPQDFADGGIVTQPTLARVGERGPEMIAKVGNQAANSRASYIGSGWSNQGPLPPGVQQGGGTGYQPNQNYGGPLPGPAQQQNPFLHPSPNPVASPNQSRQYTGGTLPGAGQQSGRRQVAQPTYTGGTAPAPNAQQPSYRPPATTMPVNRMASGGVVTSPKTVLLGESGPEMVVPLHGGRNAKTPPIPFGHLGGRAFKGLNHQRW